MPLDLQKGKRAFSKNVETEMAAGKSQKQSVAIAYAVQRRHARGGKGGGGKATGPGHSPDRFVSDNPMGEEPNRIEYHAQVVNLNTSEHPQMAGQGRGSIRETDGTDNLRSGGRVKSAAMPDSPSGDETNWPDNVDSYPESNSDRA